MLRDPREFILSATQRRDAQRCHRNEIQEGGHGVRYSQRARSVSPCAGRVAQLSVCRLAGNVKVQNTRRGAVRIDYRATTPEPGIMVTQALTHPWVVAVMPRSDLPVVGRNVAPERQSNLREK